MSEHVNGPAVSVVMPVYNAERYLPAAIASILNQTFDDFEFVIVDDGSSDGSRSVIERYASDDGRIRLISRPNTGLVGALNDGLAASRASLIARMDADDVALPHRFEMQMAYMNEHPECVALGTRVLVIDEDGDPICDMGTLTGHDELETALLEARGQMMFHPTMLMRRDAIDQVSGYERRYELAEDLSLFLRMAEHGRLANLPQVLLHYREHFEKVGRARASSERQRQVVLDITNEARQRRGMPPLEAPPDTAGGPAPSVARTYRIWGWWALRAGHVRTARKYARRALARSPWDREAWRLMYCACRGR